MIKTTICVIFSSYLFSFQIFILDIPNLYKAEIEIAYREGAMFGIKLVQQSNQFDIKSIQG